MSKPALRKFDTGATRDTDTEKLDFEGFLSPLVITRFGKYMHKHRFQKDGSMRDSDNWQKGIPFAAYMKSGLRHVVDWWRIHRGHKPLADPKDLTAGEELEDTLCAIIFNASGYLHETLKAKEAK